MSTENLLKDIAQYSFSYPAEQDLKRNGVDKMETFCCKCFLLNRMKDELRADIRGKGNRRDSHRNKNRGHFELFRVALIFVSERQA